jgi:hypothetical protein
MLTKSELETAGIRILVGIPMERNVPDRTVMSLWAIAQHGWPLVQAGYMGRTDETRNYMARQLLNSDYTHLFMMDSDHMHPEDVVERHARWVVGHPEKRIIGGLHFRRGAPYEPCIFLLDDEGYFAPNEWPKGLLTVEAVGHGTLLVHRSVFEELDYPWWAYPASPEGEFVSEDIYFCAKARKAGLDIWCDTTSTSPHVTTSLVDENTFRNYQMLQEVRHESTEPARA